jgi:alkylation response protein AidB-like acyl-CoA dehydrogenase
MSVSPSQPDHLQRLEKVIPVVREHAVEVDQTGTFPTAALDAVREAGLFGLVSSPDVGGLGAGPRAAAEVVARLAQECASTSMVVCMHYCGAAVIEKYGTEDVRRAIAKGEHLSTLAFSEAGSRSHFWAPLSSAKKADGGVRLDANKSWVTSAQHATAYVWSSQPMAGKEASTLWLVPRDAAGLTMTAQYDGLGLRGNDSAPIKAEGVVVPESARLGEDGAGFGIMMETVLPMFNLLEASCGIGLMEAAVERTAKHVGKTGHAHLDTKLADLPTIRAYVARMRIKTDAARALWLDAMTAMETGREDVMLRVLEVKAHSGESVNEVLDLAMRVCGGAALRRDVGVERYFRDGRAAGVMAPTTDVLYDFIGKAVCGLPLF